MTPVIHDSSDPWMSWLMTHVTYDPSVSWTMTYRPMIQQLTDLWPTWRMTHLTHQWLVTYELSSSIVSSLMGLIGQLLFTTFWHASWKNVKTRSLKYGENTKIRYVFSNTGHVYWPTTWPNDPCQRWVAMTLQQPRRCRMPVWRSMGTWSRARSGHVNAGHTALRCRYL